MNIIIPLKQVPDTQSTLKIATDGKSIDSTGLSWVLNPYDEFSIEAALRIKSTQPNVVVTLVSIGPDRVQQALRTGLAMGADAAVHIKMDDLLGAMTVAKVLAAFLKTRSYDLIICGKQAVDDDASTVGPALAGLLDIPQLCVLRKLDCADGMLTVEKETDTGSELWKCPLPALVTIQLGLNEPRFPSLPGIMKSKKIPIEVVPIETLGVGLKSGFTIEKLELPPERKAGRMLTGTPTEQVQQLWDALKNEAKVL